MRIALFSAKRYDREFFELANRELGHSLEFFDIGLSARTVCLDGECTPEICDPECEDAVCGPDGCGGVCGAWEAGVACLNGLCDPCAPACAPDAGSGGIWSDFTAS